MQMETNAVGKTMHTRIKMMAFTILMDMDTIKFVITHMAVIKQVDVCLDGVLLPLCAGGCGGYAAFHA